jgi:hypothetical protein
MNFRAVERLVKRELGIEGADALPAGMPRFSALDRAISRSISAASFRAWPRTLGPSALAPRR